MPFVWHFHCCKINLGRVSVLGRLMNNIFGCHDYGLPRLWFVCHDYGLLATIMVCLPRLWFACHDYGLFATIMVCLPRLWFLCHDYGLLATIMVCLPRLWFVCHDYGLFAIYYYIKINIFTRLVLLENIRQH